MSRQPELEESIELDYLMEHREGRTKTGVAVGNVALSQGKVEGRSGRGPGWLDGVPGSFL